MSNVKQLKGITPLFQAELTKQIGKITDALDDGNLNRAYNCTKTLIVMLNPTDSKQFWTNDVNHIEKKLNKVFKQKSVDSYQALRLQHSGKQKVLQEHVRSLFWKVMTQLHTGGYLEQRGPSVPVGYETGLKKLGV